VPRTREQDACPGALQVHQAADGVLVRVRLPGGALSAAQLQTLADLADTVGSGTLELTSRGSVQLRGVTDPAEVADAVAAAGLLPSATHERVRNIVASPLSGRSGGLLDVRPWVAALDTAIQADPALAGLAGRFWFSIDDGRGDVSGLAADIGVQALPDGAVALLLAGADTGVRLAGDDVVATLTLLAGRFQEIRGKRWRIIELNDTAQLLDGFTPGADRITVAAPSPPPVGWFTQDDGRVSLGAAVPLGILPARTAQFLAATDAPLIITPWRSLLICDLDEGVADVALRVLAPMDLVFDANSPWLQVSACAGSPGCERSAADVRGDARAAVRAGRTSGRHQHYVGCERACGSPLDAEVLVATADGYQPLSDRS
jgi:precorrin-3B synthase